MNSAEQNCSISENEQHYGENKSVEKARELGEWKGMEQEIVDFVKKCPTCQIQKGGRIKRQCQGIIPDTPTNPNNITAMDVVGPLLITPKGYEYILSIQDQLTNYLILTPLRNAQAKTIIKKLFDYFIYLFGA